MNNPEHRVEENSPSSSSSSGGWTKERDGTPATSDDPCSILTTIHMKETDIRDDVVYNTKEASTLPRRRLRSPPPSEETTESMKNATTMSTKSRSTSTTTKEKKDKKNQKHKKGETSADGIQSKARTSKKKKPSKRIQTTVDVPDIAILDLGEADKQPRLTTCRETEEHLKRVLDGADTLIAPVSCEKNKTKRGNSKERRRRKQRGDDEEAKPPKSPSKTVRKEEEARKRREPLLVSPFDYLQVKHFEPPQDDCSVFPDDISHLTLPKQLQELEKKHHHHDDMPSLLQILEKEQPAPYPSSKVASLLEGLSPEVEPNPGWSRKSRSRSSSRSQSFESSTLDETPRAAASTQYRWIPCHSFNTFLTLIIPLLMIDRRGEEEAPKVLHNEWQVEAQAKREA